MNSSNRNVIVKESILEAISSLTDRLVSSFGPKGMDKMIRVKKKNNTYSDNTNNILSSNTIITNDGATILEYLVNNNNNPIHRILSDISHAQDVGCGDGTTTVILLLGILYKYINNININNNLYNDNITYNKNVINNNSIIFTNTLEKIKEIAVKHIEEVKVPATDLMNAALTALNSKVASKNINMAKVAIEALSKYSINDIRRYKKIGGSIDDINIIYGMVLSVIKGNINSILNNNLLNDNTNNLLNDNTNNLLNDNTNNLLNDNTYNLFNTNNLFNKNAIVAQFCISAPKTNIDAKIDIKDYKQMELFVREEKEYIQNIIDILKMNGVEMVFIQKSLLKESVSVLATHLLNKAGIIVVDGVERKDITALCNIIGVNIVSDISILENYINNSIENNNKTEDINNITENNNDNNITENNNNNDNINNTYNNNPFVKKISFSFLDNQHITISSDACCTIVIDGIDQIVVDEGERCLNDVMSVIKVLKDDPFIVPGGCAVEAGIGIKIEKFIEETFLGGGNKNTSCLDMQLLKAAADAFYELPHLLAKNAGYYSVEVVERLKEKMRENWNLGVSMRKNKISDMLNDDNIIQPAKVSKNAVLLAIEGVEMINKIDDILPSRNI